MLVEYCALSHANATHASKCEILGTRRNYNFNWTVLTNLIFCTIIYIVNIVNPYYLLRLYKQGDFLGQYFSHFTFTDYYCNNNKDVDDDDHVRLATYVHNGLNRALYTKCDVTRMCSPQRFPVVVFLPRAVFFLVPPLLPPFCTRRF